MPRGIIVVRHGQSEHHVNRLTGGWTDTPLTPLGHRQAHLVAARLAEELAGRHVSLYTSDLARAAETSAHIGRALGVEPVHDARLREFDNGDAVNLTDAEARRRFPAAYTTSIWESDVPKFPGGETGAQFSDRCGDFLDELVEAEPVPVIVTHGGAILALVAHWLHIVPGHLSRIGVLAHPASITVLIEDRFRQVERLNDTAHLRGLEGHVLLGNVVG